MKSISHLSHGAVIWRSVMQWIGGMGIILFTLAVIPMLNHSGGMQMFNAEVTGITHDKLRGDFCYEVHNYLNRLPDAVIETALRLAYEIGVYLVS